MLMNGTKRPRSPLFTGQNISSSSSPSKKLLPPTEATQRWLETVVISQKLCPFAPPFLQQPELLRIISADSTIISTEAIDWIAKEVQYLLDPTPSDKPQHETTLAVLPVPWLADFRDMVRFSWELQEHAIGSQYQNDVQLVLFHPQAMHQTYGGEEALASDYTIRSPFPTFHLLRESDVLRAVQGGYPNLEHLPARNQARLTEQGRHVCQQRLEDCYYKDSSD